MSTNTESDARRFTVATGSGDLRGIALNGPDGYPQLYALEPVDGTVSTGEIAIGPGFPVSLDYELGLRSVYALTSQHVTRTGLRPGELAGLFDGWEDLPRLDGPVHPLLGDIPLAHPIAPLGDDVGTEAFFTKEAQRAWKARSNALEYRPPPITDSARFSAAAERIAHDWLSRHEVYLDAGARGGPAFTDFVSGLAVSTGDDGRAAFRRFADAFLEISRPDPADVFPLADDDVDEGHLRLVIGLAEVGVRTHLARKFGL